MFPDVFPHHPPPTHFFLLFKSSLEEELNNYQGNLRVDTAVWTYCRCCQYSAHHHHSTHGRCSEDPVWGIALSLLVEGQMTMLRSWVGRIWRTKTPSSLCVVNEHVRTPVFAVKPDADLRGFLYAPHPIFWDRASHWIWSSLISQTGQPLSPGSACLCLLIPGLHSLIATPHFLCEFCRLNSSLHCLGKHFTHWDIPLDPWIVHIYCPLIGQLLTWGLLLNPNVSQQGLVFTTQQEVAPLTL